MNRHQVELSRTITHALRHAPQEYGIRLDAEGWTSLSGLVEALRRLPAWATLTEGEVLEMVVVNTKRRHEVEGARIRALYGHSTPERISIEPAQPPAILFHGTTAAAAENILVEGLKPMARQYVHLSSTPDTATLVGRRHTRRPVILVVDAAGAAGAGVVFYPGGEEIWLCDAVPARWIHRDQEVESSRCTRPNSEGSGHP